MAEYASLILGAIAMMFVLIEIGFNIGTPRLIDTGDLDVMDFVKIFFVLSGFAMGFFVIALSQAVAVENAASAGLQSVLSVGMIVWGILFLALIGAFMIYYIWWVPKKLRAMLREKGKRYDDGDINS